MFMFTSRFLHVLSAAFAAGSLLACASEAVETTDLDDDADLSEDDLTRSKDVTSALVGRYAPAPKRSGAGGRVSRLFLKADKTYELTLGGSTEHGLFRGTQSASGLTLRLSPASGGSRSYRATLGSGSRPLLTLTRYAQTWLLERAPTSCDGMACDPGFACAVEPSEGVPGPACKRIAGAWQTALQGHDTWGIAFGAAAFSLNGGSSYARSFTCTLRPREATIACGNTDFDVAFWAVETRIQPDGTFRHAEGGRWNQNGSELRGRIAPDGTVTVEHYRKTECTAGCVTLESVGAVGSQKAVPICRTPTGEHPSGAIIPGTWLNCSECRGRCEGGR